MDCSIFNLFVEKNQKELFVHITRWEFLVKNINKILNSFIKLTDNIKLNYRIVQINLVQGVSRNMHA